MSGECYTMADSQKDQKSHIDVGTIISKGMQGDCKEEKSVDVNQLLEYEDMVSCAENKCSLLKGQLERIKQLYANQTDLMKLAIEAEQPKPAAVQKSRPVPERNNTFMKMQAAKMRPTKIFRQNSQHIETDNTGAALGTINNILAGITRSIQIPQLINQIKDVSSKTSHDNTANKSAIHLYGVEDVKIHTKNKSISKVFSKSKLSALRTSSRISSKASASLSVAKKIKKCSSKLSEKLKMDESSIIQRNAIPVMNKRSKKILKRRERLGQTRLPTYTNKVASATTNKDLVEIYHNKAVKESKSSESDVPKKRFLPQFDSEPQPAQMMGNRKELVMDFIPPLNIGTRDPDKECTMPFSALSRNYEMPTISSRMKQVAKYYMNSFNIKTIPFCPATSTGPSHNIGINIQQVMSMVKTKQPMQHLSPTLAYNIGLAAGKWNNNSPLSILISSMTSRIYSQCPLSRSTINYQQLQEMAKSVPQDTIEEGDETEDNLVAETHSVIITGPSGDIKISNPKQNVWTVEGDEKKCICVPKKGMEFQQIINKFNGSMSRAKLNKGFSYKPRNIQKTMSCEAIQHAPSTDGMPLQSKEKKLKEVLGKLHNEFEQMTKTYDDLSRQAEEGDTSEEVTQKLESLDKDLNSKEEEIIMVMTLYKEVLALKDQVKNLKERTYSKGNLSIRTASTRFNNGCKTTTSTAANLLNKLLKQIQHFQTHYKKN